MSSSNCWFLICIQISQEAGQMAWYSHLFQNFRQFVVIQPVKGFGIVNKAKVDVFLELFCFVDDPADVGNLISGSSAFSKSSLNIWNFTVHILLKPSLESFEHYFTSVPYSGPLYWLFCLKLSCFSNDPADVGNLISGSSVFSKTSLNIWKFTYFKFRYCWSLAGEFWALLY